MTIKSIMSNVILHLMDDTCSMIPTLGKKYMKLVHPFYIIKLCPFVVKVNRQLYIHTYIFIYMKIMVNQSKFIIFLYIYLHNNIYK